MVDTGGSAYPLQDPSCGTDGMTLLDSFAKSALPCIVGMLNLGIFKDRGYFGPYSLEEISKCSYDLAAAMIAEKRRIEAQDARTN
jgi:hypothetical protein